MEILEKRGALTPVPVRLPPSISQHKYQGVIIHWTISLGNLISGIRFIAIFLLPMPVALMHTIPCRPRCYVCCLLNAFITCRDTGYLTYFISLVMYPIFTRFACFHKRRVNPRYQYCCKPPWQILVCISPIEVLKHS